MQSNQSNSGRRTLFILAAVFLMPFTLAYTLHLVGWRANVLSSGELVQPPQSLKLRDLQDIQGKPFIAKQWTKKWTMVMVESECEATCQKQLQLLQNLRITLDKDADRVQQVLLLTADAKDFPPQNIPVLMVTDAADFASQFKVAGQATKGHLFLVDPLGNLMMNYAPGYELKGVRQDLVRLLKSSWAG